MADQDILQNTLRALEDDRAFDEAVKHLIEIPIGKDPERDYSNIWTSDVPATNLFEVAPTASLPAMGVDIVPGFNNVNGLEITCDHVIVNLCGMKVTVPLYMLYAAVGPEGVHEFKKRISNTKIVSAI